MGRRVRKRTSLIRLLTTLLLIITSIVCIIGCEDMALLQVIRERVEGISVTGVTLNESNTSIIIGSTEQLTVAVEPADATDASVSWSSDNESVATVDSDGLVTAVAGGTAQITVTTTDGGFTEACDITVTVWASSQVGSVGTAGSSITYTNIEDDFLFKVKACPGGTFPVGTDDTGEATVSAFWAGETEATNELVASVYQWAFDEGKLSTGTIDAESVALFGQQLLYINDGTTQISYSLGTFSVDSGFEEYPCVYISWYGAVLFCNWLTEMVDGNGEEVVYSGMDSDWVDGETIEDTSKTGFRLPSSYEWECAARYIGTIDPGYGVLAGGKYWTPGDFASGAVADYTDVPITGLVAWFWDNCGTDPQSHFYDDGGTWKGTHPVGTAGNSAGEGTPFTGNPNQLGMYDVSGNVYEWCSTAEAGSTRILRGGRVGSRQWWPSGRLWGGRRIPVEHAPLRWLPRCEDTVTFWALLLLLPVRSSSHSSLSLSQLCWYRRQPVFF